MRITVEAGLDVGPYSPDQEEKQAHQTPHRCMRSMSGTPPNSVNANSFTPSNRDFRDSQSGESASLRSAGYPSNPTTSTTSFPGYQAGSVLDRTQIRLWSPW